MGLNITSENGTQIIIGATEEATMATIMPHIHSNEYLFVLVCATTGSGM